MNITSITRSLASLKRQAEASHKHSRGCKKPPDQCKVCQEVIRWFGELPVGILSKVLAE